jgi:hypothetical protein
MVFYFRKSSFFISFNINMMPLLTSLLFLADAKLVRQSFEGVAPKTVDAETYMYPEKSGRVLYVTVGSKCTPLEIVGASSKFPQSGDHLSLFLSLCLCLSVLQTDIL